MINLTKNQGVLKALIESSMHRNNIPLEGTDFWMNVLAGSLKIYDKIYVYGDLVRVSEDFKAVFPLNCKIISSNCSLKGEDRQHKVSVVILHTGGRTESQKLCYYELMREISTRCNIVVWHIGK